MRLIRLSRSIIGSEEKSAVLEVLDKGFLGMGPLVGQFENKLSEFFGRDVVCVSSGTAALHLALQAAGIGKGHEVLVPSITYLASYQAICATGAIPISCDVDESSLCLSAKDAVKKITERTRAIMPVHYAGGVGDLDQYYKIASTNNLRVIEDAAHAFGTHKGGKKIGSFGDISCFSFDGIKNITSGEGGCIVTSDKEVLELARNARLLGVIGDSESRLKGERTWNLNVKAQGWRYHMSDIMAAIGIEQLKKIDHFSSRRQFLAKRYYEQLEPINQLDSVLMDFSEIVPHIYPVKLNKGINRDEIRKELLSLGIQTGIHYPPNHLIDYFKVSGYDQLKVAERIAPQLITLPLHTGLKKTDIDYVVQNLKHILTNY